MKVEFLRNYEKYIKGEQVEIKIKPQEEKYLLNTGTIRVLEKSEKNAPDEEIPKVKIDE